MKIVPATVDCASGIAGVHVRSWQDQRGIKFHEAFGFVPVLQGVSLDIVRGSTLSRGSGLLIGPRQVLTAAHNIYDRSGNRPDSVHVAPARNRADLPFGRIRAICR